MDQHYFLVCPVNSQNEEKLAGQGEACLRLLTNATYPRPGDGHATVHSVSDCQKHNVYCSIIIVGPSEEAKSQVQGSHKYELLNLPKRQRAKRKSNVAVANIGARIQPGSCMRQNCYCLTIKLHHPLVYTHSVQVHALSTISSWGHQCLFAN